MSKDSDKIKEWRILSLLETLAVDYPPEQAWVEPDLIVRNGKTQLYGRTGTGKSMLTIQLAFALAANVPWIGYPVAGPANVLYVQSELAPAYAQKRYKAMYEQFPEAEGRVFFSDEYDRTLAHEGDFAALADGCTKHAIDILVVDPLYLFMIGNENSAEDTRRFLHGMNSVGAHTGATAFLVHHAGKMTYASGGGGAIDRGSDSSRGSANLVYWPDTIIRLAKAEEGRHVVHWQKTRHAEEPKDRTIKFNKKTLVFEEMGLDPSDAIALYLADGTMPLADLNERVMAECEVGTKTVQRARKRLEEQGKIMQYLVPGTKTWVVEWIA